MAARHSRQNREYESYLAKDQVKSLRGGAEVARQAHNLEVGGSIPPPAIRRRRMRAESIDLSFIPQPFEGV